MVTRGTALRSWTQAAGGKISEEHVQLNFGQGKVAKEQSHEKDI